MDPLSAGIAAGGSLFTSVLGNIFGKKNTDDTNQMNYQIAQMNNQFNQDMFERQMLYNTEMWNKQNAYNDPSAQRKRLEDAGINPWIAMSGGNSAGTASGAMGVNPPTAQGVTMQPFHPSFDATGFHTAAQMIYNQKKMDADIAKSYEEQRGIELQNDRQQIDNMFVLQEHLNQLAHSSIDYKTKSRQYQMLNDTWRNIGYEGELMQAQRRYYDQQSVGIDLENTYRSIRNQNAPELFKLEISQRANDILYKKAQTNMTNTQVVHEIEKMIETQARSAGLEISNKNAKDMADAIVRTAYYNADKAYYDSYHKIANPFEILSRLRNEK